MKTHVASVHKGNNPCNKCDICETSFADKYRLKMHTLNHSMKESNHVNSMGKGFSTRKTIFSPNFLYYYFMLEINMH